MTIPLAKIKFFALGLSLVSLTQGVWAFPQYSIKENKACVTCHYDSKGGGPTNGKGRYYKQHMTLEGYVDKVKKKKPAKGEEP
jgi:hypothetical protein